MFIYGVPKINLRPELKNLCSKYGKVIKIYVTQGYKIEAFTECYHVQFDRIQSARIAKRLLDNRSFYGGILHVCYAPEFESVEETRLKLLQRNKDVLNRLPNQNESFVKPINKEKIFDNRRVHIEKQQANERIKLQDIYSEDDPILRKPTSNPDAQMIGPKMPEQNIFPASSSKRSYEDSIENSECKKPKIIPSQVKLPEKRIVFKKDIIKK